MKKRIFCMVLIGMLSLVGCSRNVANDNAVESRAAEVKQTDIITDDKHISENEPEITIGQPQQIEDFYRVTVTDNTQQKFMLGLEEIVLPTKERNIKTVFMENGKGTFETKNTGIYRPLYYCCDVKKISEENITINVVKGYAEIEKDSQPYTEITLCPNVKLEMSDSEETRGYFIYDIEKSTGEYISDMVALMNVGEQKALEKCVFTAKDKNEDVRVKIIPRYFVFDKETELKFKQNQDCRKFIEEFRQNYKKEIPLENISLLEDIFYSYFQTELTQEQWESIYESRVSEKERDEFADKFIEYYINKHLTSFGDLNEEKLKNETGVVEQGEVEEVLAEKEKMMSLAGNMKSIIQVLYSQHGSEMTMEEYEQEYEKAVQKQNECEDFIENFLANYKGERSSAFDAKDTLQSIFYQYYGKGLTQEQYEKIFEMRNWSGTKPFEEEVIAGLVDENTPYITLKQAEEIALQAKSTTEVYNKLCAIRPPDNTFRGSGVYGGDTFIINEHEYIYYNIDRRNIEYFKKGNDGTILDFKVLYPYPKATVPKNEDEPEITIGQPKKIGSSYEVTVVSDTKQKFILALEENVTATGELYTKTVFMENGTGTFETAYIGTYRPIYYQNETEEVSEKNITDLVKGYSYRTEGNEYYCDVTVSFKVNCDSIGGMLVYDIESDREEITVHSAKMYNGESCHLKYTVKLSSPKEKFIDNTKIIPQYIIKGNRKYF